MPALPAVFVLSCLSVVQEVFPIELDLCVAAAVFVLGRCACVLSTKRSTHAFQDLLLNIIVY